MIIQKIRLQNWKNFADAQVRLARRAFIVGPNAAGKSNLLDALRFLRDVAKPKGGGLQAAVENRGGVSAIRRWSANPESDVLLEIHLGPTDDGPARWKYRLAFNEERVVSAQGNEPVISNQGKAIGTGAAVITEESVWCEGNLGDGGKTGDWILARTAESEKDDPESLKSTHLEQTAANKKFRPIREFLQGMEYLNIVPQLVREGDSYVLTGKKEDYHGKTLLKRMQNTPPERLERHLKTIGGYLHHLAPWFGQIRLSTDPDGAPRLNIFCDLPDGPKPMKENQFSDGTLRILGLLWALLEGQGTVLLEEPELHLHTAVIRLLPEWIARLQIENRGAGQVILTTHSFDLLSNEGIGGEEVILLKAERTSTKIHRAEDLERVRKYLDAGFSMAEAVIPETAPKEVDSDGLEGEPAKGSDSDDSVEGAPE